MSSKPTDLLSIIPDDSVCCTKEDILDFSKMISHEEHRPLGRELGIDDQFITHTETQVMVYQYDYSEIPYQILMKWREMKGSGAIKAILRKAIIKIRKEIKDHKCSASGAVSVKDGEDRLNEIKEDIIRKQKKAYSEIELPQVPWTNKILPLSELYISLELQSIHGKYEVIDDEPTDIQQLFCMTDGQKEPLRILVEGPPGIGKSTFCAKLLSDWAADKAYLVSKFKMIFLFELRYMLESDSFKDIFIQECKGEGYDDDDIINLIMKYQKDILLILDGFDEMSETGKRKVIPLIQAKEFKSMFVVVTSRNEMFEWEEEENIRRSVGRMKQQERNSNRLQMFDKRILIKGINKENIGNFLLNYFGENYHDLKYKLSYVTNGELSEICQCPLFLLLLAMMLQDGIIKDIHSKTFLYKEFFNFIVRRGLVREKILEENEKLDIFSLCATAHLSEYNYIESLKLFGRYALTKVMQNILVFEEKDILVNCNNDKMILKLGLLIKASKIENRQKQIYYEPIHRSFLEFLAAFAMFNIFISFGAKEFTIEMEKFVKDGLLPTDVSLFYVFLGGFLDSHVCILFEMLIPYSFWFNLQNICFTNILLEIEDLESFYSSFVKLIHLYVPSHYSVGKSFDATNKRLYSSKIYSFIIDHALKLSLIIFFHYSPCSYIRCFDVAYFDQIHITFSEKLNAPQSSILFKCKTLSVEFKEGFKIDLWSKVIGIIDSIEKESIIFSFHKFSNVLPLLHKELTESKWKAKIIDRLMLKVSKDDDLGCLHLLIDLVDLKRIHEGVYVEIYNSRKRAESEITQLRAAAEDLWQSVSKSNTITDFKFRNNDSSVSPVFDFCHFNREKEISEITFHFYGSLVLLNHEKEMLSLSQLNLESWEDENKQFNVIKNIHGIQYLKCLIKCFDYLVEEHYEGLNDIKELFLFLYGSHTLNSYTSQLINLQVLILQFSTSFAFSSQFAIDFSHTLAFLNLRILQVRGIHTNRIKNFELIVKSLFEGLQVKDQQREKFGVIADRNEYLLQEFNAFHFLQKLSSKYDCVYVIQSMLKMKFLREFSLVRNVNTNLTELPFAFPFSEGFKICTEIDGIELTNSHQNRMDYRWLDIHKKFIITADK